MGGQAREFAVYRWEPTAADFLEAHREAIVSSTDPAR
jgi:hypothetical protein